jgi:hypothetical protein
VSYPSTGHAFAGVWGWLDLLGGTGRLAVYMTGAVLEDGAYRPVRENLQTFLQDVASFRPR